MSLFKLTFEFWFRNVYHHFCVRDRWTLTESVRSTEYIPRYALSTLLNELPRSNANHGIISPGEMCGSAWSVFGVRSRKKINMEGKRCPLLKHARNAESEVTLGRPTVPSTQSLCIGRRREPRDKMGDCESPHPKFPTFPGVPVPRLTSRVEPQEGGPPADFDDCTPANLLPLIGARSFACYDRVSVPVEICLP